jgi:hypothetical protein
MWLLKTCLRGSTDTVLRFTKAQIGLCLRLRRVSAYIVELLLLLTSTTLYTTGM